MHLLVTLALTVSLLSIAYLVLSDFERELLMPPPRAMRNDSEEEDR